VRSLKKRTSPRLRRANKCRRGKELASPAWNHEPFVDFRVLRKLLPLIAGGFFASGVCLGQMSTDEVPRERTVPTRETVKDEVENRRFRLGPFRLNPILEISDLGYDSNVFGAQAGQEVSDWSMGARAGVQWIVPVGSKLYIVGEATPTYIWYRELSERRFFGGRYSTALLGFFNRASLEVGGYNAKVLNYVSNETKSKVIETILDGTGKIEIDVASNLSVFGGIEVARLRYGNAGGDPNPPDLSGFQRQEAAARGGLRYRINQAFDVTAGYEKAQVEFVNVPQERDNQSDAFLLGIHYNRPKLFLNVAGAYREGKPYNGSTFQPYSNATGSFYGSYFLTRKVEVKSYGRQRVSYGLQAAQYLESTFGGGFNFQVHPRALLSVTADTGTNKYPAQTSGSVSTPARTDRVMNYTGSASVIVYRKMVVTANATRFEYSSPDATLNRRIFRFTTSIGFQGLFVR